MCFSPAQDPNSALNTKVIFGKIKRWICWNQFPEQQEYCNSIRKGSTVEPGTDRGSQARKIGRLIWENGRPLPLRAVPLPLLTAGGHCQDGPIPHPRWLNFPFRCLADTTICKMFPVCDRKSSKLSQRPRHFFRPTKCPAKFLPIFTKKCDFEHLSDEIL